MNQGSGQSHRSLGWGYVITGNVHVYVMYALSLLYLLSACQLDM
jgi:hypothetical protein